MNARNGMIALALCGFTCLPLSGCGGGNPSAAAPLVSQPLHSPSWQRLYHVTGTSYVPSTQTVKVYAKPVYMGVANHHSLAAVAGEKTIDMSNFPGVVNMATSQFAGKPVQHVQVYTDIKEHGHLMADLPATLGTGYAGGSTMSSGTTRNGMTGAYVSGSNFGSIHLPPPGVQMDPSLTPVANLRASQAAKESAVLQIARSKLGTPYIWGHNEDRGQYGFDCSNFVAYVYHHSLGYVFSGASLVQNATVGVSIPRSSMIPGDLIMFENGKHEGIYAGNGQMIEEGGGLGKVGYLSVGAGSYWGSRITSVRRMF